MPGFDETEGEVRYRIRDPQLFEEGTLRYISLDEEKGIRALVGLLKGGGELALQSLRFDKAKGWNIEEARRWLEEHPEVLQARVREAFVGRFEAEEQQGGPLKIRGLLATSRTSRNGNYYLPQELEKATRLLQGKTIPIYLEHIAAGSAVGEARLEYDPIRMAVRYEGIIYDDEVAEKIRKGLIRHVSLGADYDRLDRLDGVTIPRGLSFREISLVAVPGIPESNIEWDEVKEGILEALMVKGEPSHRIITVTPSSGVTSQPQKGTGNVAPEPLGPYEEERVRMEERVGIGRQVEEPSPKGEEIRAILRESIEAQRRMADAMRRLAEALVPNGGKEDAKDRALISRIEEELASPKGSEEDWRVAVREKARRFFITREFNYVSWSIPRLEIPEAASPKQLVEFLDELDAKRRRLQARLREALSTAAGGTGKAWAPPTFVIPPDLPAMLRNTALVANVPRGAKDFEWTTITAPAFGALTENAEPVEATHTITSKVVTPSPRGWQQSISYELEQKFGNGDILEAISESARLVALLDEDAQLLTSMDQEAAPAAVLYGDESVADEASVTSAMTFEAARLRSAIEAITSQGYSPDGLVAVLHPKQFRALMSDPNLVQAQQYGSSDVIRRGIISDVYGIEIRRSTQVPTGTGSTGITTYHAFIYKRDVTLGLAVSRELLLETFRDIRRNQTVIKVSHDMAATVLQPKSMVKVVTA